MFSSWHHSKVLAFLLFCLTVTAVQATDVWGFNVPPVAKPVTITVCGSVPKGIDLIGSDDMTPSINLAYRCTKPLHGSVVDPQLTRGECTATYQANPGYTGPDSFSYQVFDGWLWSNPATVNITVAPNRAPIATNTSKTVSNAGWNVVYLPVSDPDVFDPYSWTRAWSAPAHGTLRAGRDGSVLYRPQTGYTGPDSFTFWGSDGMAESNRATCTLTVVTGSGAAPVAKAGSATVFPVAGGFRLFLQATDAENDGLTRVYSQPAHGSLVEGLEPCEVFYTPAVGYVGPDAFTFQASDGRSLSTPVTFTLDVRANTVPEAFDVTIDIPVGQSANFVLPGYDPDGSMSKIGDSVQQLTYRILNRPPVGILTEKLFEKDAGLGKWPLGRTWTYTPPVNFSGSTNLTFQVEDGFATSRTATLTIRVRPFGPTEHGQARVVAVVDATLYPLIQTEINTWLQDLTAEGYRPFVKTWPRGTSAKDNVAAKALWEWLRNEYFTNGLQGAVLFGQLPVPMEEWSGDDVGVTIHDDAAYGLLAAWKPTGLSLEHQAWVQGNCSSLGNPVIWTSRLWTSSDVEMRWYLRANHEQRIGKSRLPHVAYSLYGISPNSPIEARSMTWDVAQYGLAAGQMTTLLETKYYDITKKTVSTCTPDDVFFRGGGYARELSHGDTSGNGVWGYARFNSEPCQTRMVGNSSCGSTISSQSRLLFGRHGKLTNIDNSEGGRIKAAALRPPQPLDLGGSLGENLLWQGYDANFTVGDYSLGLTSRFPENHVPQIVSAECVSGAIVAGRPSTWRLRVTDPDAPSGNNPFVPWQFKSEWYLNGWNVDLNPTLTSDTTQTAAWTFDATTKVWTNQSTLTFTQAQTRVIRTLVLDEWQALAWKDQTIAVAPDPTQPLRINCGSNQSWKVNNYINPPADYTDGQGHIWFHCQTFMTGGWGWTCGNSGYVFTGSPIAGTDLDPLFQSGLTVRDPVKPLSYRIPLPNGRYTVNLGFAALTETAAGQAVMDVAIEGQVVLDDLDVFAAAGAAKTALWRTFTAQVNDGELTIVFTRLAVSTKDPAICAIEILPLQIPPTCAITAPTGGSTFAAPANITITANAADSNGTIAKVEFFQGTTKLGEDTTSPYSYAWNNVAAGAYTLSVKATDNDGAVTTSAAVAITVQATQDRSIIMDLLPGLIWNALEPDDATVLPPSGDRQTIQVRSQQSTLLAPVVGTSN